MFPCRRGSCQALHIWNSCKQSKGSHSREQPGAAGTSRLATAALGGTGWKSMQNRHAEPRTGAAACSTCRLSLEAPVHTRASSLSGGHERLQTHLLCPQAIIASPIPTWKSHPLSSVCSTVSLSQLLKCYLRAVCSQWRGHGIW